MAPLELQIFFGAHDIPIKGLEWPLHHHLQHQPQCKCECNISADNEEWSVLHHLSTGKIHLSIILQSKKSYKRPNGYKSSGYITRRKAIDMAIPLFTNLQEAQMFVEAINKVPSIEIGAPDQLTTHTDEHIIYLSESNSVEGDLTVLNDVPKNFDGERSYNSEEKLSKKKQTNPNSKSLNQHTTSNYLKFSTPYTNSQNSVKVGFAAVTLLSAFYGILCYLA